MPAGLRRRRLLAWDAVASWAEYTWLRLRSSSPAPKQPTGQRANRDEQDAQTSAVNEAWSMWPAIQEALRAGADPEELGVELNKVAQAHAAKVVMELRRTAPRMLREHRVVARGMRRRMRAIWGPGFDLVYQVYVSAEEIGARIAQLQSTTEDELTQALLGLHARGCLILSELHTLCTAGYPLGAWARARSLQETAVIAGVLSEYGREPGLEDLGERFLAHAVTEQLRDMREAQGSGLSVEVEQMQAVQQAALDARARYGPGFGGPYGWARPLFPTKAPKDLITYNDLAGLHDSGLTKLDYRLGSHHVHATAWSVELNTVERGAMSYRLTGAVNLGFTEPIGVALSAMQASLQALLFGSVNPVEATDLLALHAVAELSVLAVENCIEAQDEVDRREDSLQARLVRRTR